MTDLMDPMTVSRPRIRIEGAVKSFSGRVVVDIDELVLGAQPIGGLIGPNGAGKTTLMRMIMHSTPLDRGKITLLPSQGEEVVLSSLPTHRMARHGVVKSNQVIMDFEKLTIWDSLLLALAEAKYEQPHRVFSEKTLFEEHADAAREYLRYFSFDNPAGFAQSAGEKKLLDIVRCLLLKPKFLLLDEPTAGLPGDVRDRVMALVKEKAASENVSVVIVEHDLNVIWSMSDYVHFMAEGSVILQGDPAWIRKHETVVEKYLGSGHVGS